MNSAATSLAALGLSAALLIAACAPDHALPGDAARDDEGTLRTEGRPGEAGLGAQLERALATHGGRASFMLPESVDALPADPANPLTEAKVALGRALFHDPLLAHDAKRREGRYTYACATCHHADAGFQASTAQGLGEGGQGFLQRVRRPSYPESALDIQGIRSPSVLHVAYQGVMLWSGALGAHDLNVPFRAFWREGPTRHNREGWLGVEVQALAGLGTHRLSVEHSRLRELPAYRQLFAEAFGEGEVITQRNAALALAAYQRTLVATRAPWQRWLRGEAQAMDEAQMRGALVFFGRGGCVSCHNGPALSSDTFHALGFADLDRGAGKGPMRLGRAGFTREQEDLYAHKTPQLYNLKDAPVLGHGGSHDSVDAIIAYKNRAQPENAWVPERAISPLFRPLGLSEDEMRDLGTFIKEALYDAELDRYVPERVPSGMCFPANDELARRELGCD